MQLTLALIFVAALNLVETKSYEPQEKASILARFFSMEGVEINTQDENVVNKYNDEVIEEMEESIKNFKDPLKVYHVNAAVNSLIYKLKTLHVDETSKLIEPMDEAMLQALDLMMPDSADEPVYKLAKDDLRKFYLEQPELGKELLDRIRTDLEYFELHTEGVADYLKKFYYRWIPLGRLGEFIKANAKNA